MEKCLDYKRLKDAEKICSVLSKNQFLKDYAENTQIGDPSVLRPYFLKSLNFFSTETIKAYFTERTRDLEIVRMPGIGEVKLEKKIYIPDTPLTLKNQIEYANAMGFIPNSEVASNFPVLPFILEFVTEISKNPNPSRAFDNFLFHRIEMEGKSHNSSLEKYETSLRALNYVIQLIERSNVNKEAVTKEIEAIIDGKHLEDAAKALFIDINDYSHLIGEVNRIKHL